MNTALEPRAINTFGQSIGPLLAGLLNASVGAAAPRAAARLVRRQLLLLIRTDDACEEAVMSDAAPADRESLLVELVDDSGNALGSTSVASAHAAPGRPHRAFSVVLNDGTGRVLLQRRAAVKTRFPQRWSNACCGHPAPGQDVLIAAIDRLRDELRITVDLKETGVYRYRAEDPVTGRVEDEYDHVLVGTLASGDEAQGLSPNPAEVSEVRWVPIDDLLTDLAAFPQRFTPWLPGVLAVSCSSAH